MSIGVLLRIVIGSITIIGDVTWKTLFPHMFLPPKTRWTGWFWAGVLDHHVWPPRQPCHVTAHYNGSIGVHLRGNMGLITDFGYTLPTDNFTPFYDHSSLYMYGVAFPANYLHFVYSCNQANHTDEGLYSCTAVELEPLGTTWCTL